LSSSGPRIPTLTSAQVAEVDRLAAERFAIPVDWLMEAAGWQLARRCPGRTLVACGTGYNGGDGLAAARHLHGWGRLAAVACLDPGSLRGPAQREADALRALGVEITTELEVADAELVLDAILGTGLNRPPAGRHATWINRINESGARVVAVDVPSGLDADSGRAFDPCVQADLTVTLGLPKPGLLQGQGPRLAGQLWVADIGIPLEAYRELGLAVPADLYAAGDTLQMGP
jgi:NAD(P)H-hydrate epimerase